MRITAPRLFVPWRMSEVSVIPSETTDNPAVELKDGQVYRWRWTDEDLHNKGLSGWSTYHCKSRIAVVQSGRLVDTYWFGGGAESVIDPKAVTLTLIAETSWPTIRDHDVPLYSADDVVDTRHANSSNAPIYLRPGAQRSAAAINKLLARRQEEAERDMRSAMWQMEQIGKMRLLLAEGRLGEVY